MKKKSKIFYDNFGIRAVVIYFYFVLIDLINDYKNIYSHKKTSNIIIIIIIIIIIMRIVSMKRDRENIFRFVSILF